MSLPTPSSSSSLVCKVQVLADPAGLKGLCCYTTEERGCSEQTNRLDRLWSPVSSRQCQLPLHRRRDGDQHSLQRRRSINRRNNRPSSSSSNANRLIHSQVTLAITIAPTTTTTATKTKAAARPLNAPQPAPSSATTGSLNSEAGSWRLRVFGLPGLEASFPWTSPSRPNSAVPSTSPAPKLAGSRHISLPMNLIFVSICMSQTPNRGT
mmetsp:Transcript_16132/g.35404  ORF Transcript_16132/g.35404 Transcript_16132/m.35404 type:complete len:209 (-) Transcript_16132:20-646(-)